MFKINTSRISTVVFCFVLISVYNTVSSRNLKQNFNLLNKTKANFSRNYSEEYENDEESNEVNEVQLNINEYNEDGDLITKSFIIKDNMLFNSTANLSDIAGISMNTTVFDNYSNVVYHDDDVIVRLNIGSDVELNNTNNAGLGFTGIPENTDKSDNAETVIENIQDNLPEAMKEAVESIKANIRDKVKEIKEEKKEKKDKKDESDSDSDSETEDIVIPYIDSINSNRTEEDLEAENLYEDEDDDDFDMMELDQQLDEGFKESFTAPIIVSSGNSDNKKEVKVKVNASSNNNSTNVNANNNANTNTNANEKSNKQNKFKIPNFTISSNLNSNYSSIKNETEAVKQQLSEDAEIITTDVKEASEEIQKEAESAAEEVSNAVEDIVDETQEAVEEEIEDVSDSSEEALSAIESSVAETEEYYKEVSTKVKKEESENFKKLDKIKGNKVTVNGEEVEIEDFAKTINTENFSVDINSDGSYSNSKSS